MVVMGVILLIAFLQKPRQFTKPVFTKPTGWIIGLYGILAALALVSAMVNGWFYLTKFKMGLVVAGAVVVVWVLWSKPSLCHLQPAIALMLIIHSSLALMQAFLQRSLGLHRIGELPRMSAAPGSPVLYVNGELVMRAFGLSRHPNILGAFLITGALLLFLPQVSNRWFRLLCRVGLVFGLAGTVVTFSRSAALGFALGVGALCMSAVVSQTWTRSLGMSVLIALVVMGGGYTLTRETVQSRVSVSENPVEERSISSRRAQVPLALDLIRSSPLIGVGPANSGKTIIERTGESTNFLIHNLPLMVTAELGVVGGAVWVLVLLTPLYFLWKPTAETGLIAASLVPFILIDNVDVVSWVNAGGYLYHWFLLTLLALQK